MNTAFHDFFTSEFGLGGGGGTLKWRVARLQSVRTTASKYKYNIPNLHGNDITLLIHKPLNNNHKIKEYIAIGLGMKLNFEAGNFLFSAGV